LTLLFALLNAVSPAPGPLRVLRAAPETPAEPNAVITITFDRPIAGGLEESIDPAAIFRITPALQGKLEWRDPMSLRFTPALPFEPERTYTVTIAPTFQAMDGSRLEGPYEFSFRIAAPRVLTGFPVNEHNAPQHLPANPVFMLLVSAPVQAAVLERYAAVQLDRACGSTRIPVRVNEVRRLRDNDPSHFRWTGIDYRMRDDTARDMRRVVEAVPTAPLPRSCGAALLIPRNISATPDSITRWLFRTYGPLRLEAVRCAWNHACPTGPIVVQFSTPVKGTEVLRRVRIVPNAAFTIRDTAEEGTIWPLSARLQPRNSYAVVVDSLITDVFGQKLTGVKVRATQTTGYSPTVSYEYGRLLVEREGLRTLPVQHVNVDTLFVIAVPVPDSMEAEFLNRDWNWNEPWAALRSRGTVTRVPVRSVRDDRLVTGVRLPVSTQAGGATLYAVQVSSPLLDSIARRQRPTALVQVTNLGVHARVGTDHGMVWVTGVNDGLPRAGVNITIYDSERRTRGTGRTDAQGLARIENLRPLGNECADWCEFEGYIAAQLGADRALVGLNSYDSDLSAWRFGVYDAWGKDRHPSAAAVFTERGIYRPGEPVYAKAIVRNGPLGSLLPPARTDSVRWIFKDRDEGVLADTIMTLSAFGTAERQLRLGPDLPLGWYGIELQQKRGSEWRPIAYGSYQVAEYRPPEFLVETVSDRAPRYGGDTITVNVSARYLFGAPMARAPVRWTVLQRPLQSWELEIPNTEGFQVGAGPIWWEEEREEEGPTTIRDGTDTLDATGQLALRLPLPTPSGGRGANITVQTIVTDANRQVVTSGTSALVHPAAIYIGARARGERWFWTAGTPVTLDVITVRPEGERVSDVAVRGTIVRREWHVVRRTRDGQIDDVGSWVSDTVATCDVRTRAEPVPCTFTPREGGSYVVTLSALDAQGRAALTRFSRWASGAGWVPWNDRNKLKMDVVPDRERYSVGDTATVLFASPFTNAEAWITVERERVLESRRIRITDGATTLRFPITEAYAPNAFVSIVVVRGRSAAPGPLDDPGRPTLRVGYAELRVTPETKRLTVELRPLAAGAAAPADADMTQQTADMVEYQPGDSARVAVLVRDRNNAGQRSEVTLWAVDEGVLALTGYRVPDPIDLLYARRGLGVRLRSNLVRVAPQIPDGQKGTREPGGGGGADQAGILRTRFQTTAFFLGSVVTDANGRAVAVAKLPDNLTTFRVMAVAVTAGDRYGSGSSKFLVTRPLVARPALPRFVREGDRFAAGVIVNQRLNGTPEVQVDATARGIGLQGGKKKSVRLAEGRGAEVRFDFLARIDDKTRTGRDSAYFQFTARSGKDADAVLLGIPYRPNHFPVAATIAGVLRDTASAEFVLENDVDPASSRLEISFGSSTAAIMRGLQQDLRVYPYYCSEQLSSIALPIVAQLRARRQMNAPVDPVLEREVQNAVRSLVRRQNAEGGIGYWSALDWSTPWLSSYAGRVLLEARAAGVPVDTAVLSRVADYLARKLQETDPLRVPVAWWYLNDAHHNSERLAAVDFLSRYGRPDLAAENLLLVNASRLRWEDRVLLAEVFARRNDINTARTLLAAAWSTVSINGRNAVLPRNAYESHYFHSYIRPAARLLTATLMVERTHPLVGPLAETLIQKGRAEAAMPWNTQDYGWAVLALMQLDAERRAEAPARVVVRSGRRTLLNAAVNAASPQDTAFSLDGLVSKQNGKNMVRLQLQTPQGGPLYYYVTVREQPKGPQTTGLDRGIVVERWFESVDQKRPISSAQEGQLVRVRLRITTKEERHFVVLDDPLPAGLEAVDLSLRTMGGLSAFVDASPQEFQETQWEAGWYYGSWDAGFWSPFDHKELRDDRVVYSASVLWPGTYTVSYLARATTPGTFVLPPARSEEMYNPGVNGRTGGGTFTVTPAR
jgi:uncharacterized protein YfaS (alpha-2-macroglobulin family)